MQAFKIHKQVVDDYTNYLKSFTQIKNTRIKKEVEKAFSEGLFLPDALIQFNPSYEIGLALKDLEKNGVHPSLSKCFGSYNLYQHQIEAITKGLNKKSFVVTSGTGSGKSLTYISTIFNRIFKLAEAGEKLNGVKAIIVYPMNALINSQEDEIKKYEINYLKSFLPGIQIDESKSLNEQIEVLKSKTTHRFPVVYGKYTGQEGQADRDKLKNNGVNVILTNYMMLELIMTRNSEGWLRNSMKESLEYLVFDELHTYRGRQGADVAMLIRRIKSICSNKLFCIGTSATMASGTSSLVRKETVANVARQIFGETYTADDVIEETLSTCTDTNGKLPSSFDLQEAIGNKINANGKPEGFRKHTLAIWLENRVALKKMDNVYLERGTPISLNAIAELLHHDSGEDIKSCKEALLEFLAWTERLNIEGSKQFPRKSYLPFKIHQFISQTGNVYVTLDTKTKRKISLEMERYIKIDGKDQNLYPVLFSRHTGYDFLCVKLENGKITPRDPDELPERITKDELKGDAKNNIPKRVLNIDDFTSGYIIIPEEGDDLWTQEDIDSLPDNWFKETKKYGRQIDNFYEYRLPMSVSFDTEGNFAFGNEYPIKGWYIAAKIILDPTAGVIYDNNTNENTKLMRLGNEGRSTATTITSFSILKALSENGISSESQKLLSFTDNRQDASLQAGHFNDFIMLGRLRSAIYYALKDAPNNTLDIESVSDAVFEKIKLKETEYARNPSTDPTNIDKDNIKAIKDYLTLRILYDLKRGWRYNTPNLEQCGLLDVGYKGLGEVVVKDEKFVDIDILKQLKPTERLDFFNQLLNYFRTSYAFNYYKLLEGRDRFEESLRNRLNSDLLWSLDADEKIEVPAVMMVESVGKTREYTVSAGTNSYLGKYLKRLYAKYKLEKPKSEELKNQLYSICELLTNEHVLSKVDIKGEKGTVKGYRLRIEKVLWKLGDGKTVMNDLVRIANIKDISAESNNYFKKFYQQDFTKFAKPIVGSEHTGQLGNADRIDREDSFKKGDISTLYCSPTMELGIDISQLNVVHMRNVPPSPANYAQRSGRAGRSGQAALVFTYCSNGSPHDRNYFADSKKMVAGTVAPPKIDLTNEELILTHFNAYIMMELGLESVKKSVGDVLDLSDVLNLPVQASIKNYIEDQVEKNYFKWAYTFKGLLESITEINVTKWFTEEWLSNYSKSFYKRFDESFNRWRYLFKSADVSISAARAIIDDFTIKDSTRKKEAENQAKRGQRIKTLLVNSDQNGFSGESEFYVYRYLAAEGFLPGYNFTRLPIRTFLGYKYKNQGEFVSRPRFVALKEFGPGNSIYHKGEKFKIDRMDVTQVAEQMNSIIISKRTGYAFLQNQSDGVGHHSVNNDPITNQELKGEENIAIYKNLLSLRESEARPMERISCEEEERMSAGYKIDQFFSFARGLEPTQKVVIEEAGNPLIQLIYDQSAQLIQLNRGWRIAKTDEKDGFNIGNISGRWKKGSEVEANVTDDIAVNAMVYTTDTADILYIQPVKELDISEEGVTSLAFALKRAIERQYQVEESEIGVWIMGAQEEKNILIYEAAEGSLGILSNLVQDSQALKSLFKEAYRVLHFDVETREDTKPDYPKATYEDLLSYYNQMYHKKLDRFSVKEALERLIDCDIDNQQGGGSLREKYTYLLNNYDLNSATEKPLIEFLYKNGIQLPDKAQYNVPECYVSADFVFKSEACVTLVFCDGTVHDSPEQKQKDKKNRQLCRDMGYDVIEWHYTEPLEQLVERRKDIFRKVR